MKSIQIIMILVCIGIPCLEMQSQENAAVIYWRAFHEAQHIPKNFTKNAIAYINGEKKYEQKCFQVVEKHQSAIHEVNKAVKLPFCNFVLKTDYNDGAQMLLPHLYKMNNLAILIVIDAVKHIKRGNITQGIKQLIAVVKMARHTYGDDILISYLVAKKIVQPVFTIINNKLSQIKISQKDSEKLILSLHTFEKSLDIKRSLQTERDYLLLPYKKRLVSKNKTIQYRAVGEILGFWFTEMKLKKSERREVILIGKKLLTKKTISKKEKKRIAFLLQIAPKHFVSKKTIISYFIHSINQYGEFINKLIYIFSRPAKEAMQDFLKLKVLIPKSSITVRMFFPSFEKIIYKHFTLITRCRMHQLLLALIYQKRYGIFPRNLPMKKNPLTGDSFKYKIQDNTIIIDAGKSLDNKALKILSIVK